MILKLKEKEKAIKLRKRGLSYSEILKKISVAKSTLSLWLRSVGLARKQKQRLTEKRLAAALRGSIKKREQRIAITNEIKTKARNEIGKLSNRELWLTGVALYWAEGTKQKEHNVSQKVKFSNTDPIMIKVFLRWLQNICGIPKSEISFRISLHETAINKLDKVQKYWAKITGLPINNFQKIDWKKHRINTKRKNTGEKYFGLLNVYIRNSTNLNRKIQGWIEGIYKNSGVV